MIDGDHSYYSVMTDTLAAARRNGMRLVVLGGLRRRMLAVSVRSKLQKSMKNDENRFKSEISQVLRQIPCCLDTIVYHDYCMPEVYRAIQEFANAGS